ncbi:hypothetical protein [Bacillus solimangrovi]|uniref:DUF4367 domain-containing protein n=1 Tax=Bacillus solimangrovi TaxID=1305675 RepID=A0A1E5LJB5_9BACI|nr:hypothetical protein [Bacillus solimangrovi]OEH94189.1 hypothetical protein BFG57_09055 [Bacillus solimangrovi]
MRRSKKKFIFFSTVLVVIVSWALLRTLMYDLDQTELANIVEDLPFEVKTPTKVPFKQMKVWGSTIADDQQQITIDLTNINKESVTIRMTTNEVDYFYDSNKKKVTIDKGIQGIFIANVSNKRILAWEDNGVQYEITFYPKLKTWEVSKRQLIKMAQSFQKLVFYVTNSRLLTQSDCLNVLSSLEIFLDL